jgi:hypothetical protein
VHEIFDIFFRLDMNYLMLTSVKSMDCFMYSPSFASVSFDYVSCTVSVRAVEGAES